MLNMKISIRSEGQNWHYRHESAGWEKFSAQRIRGLSVYQETSVS